MKPWHRQVKINSSPSVPAKDLNPGNKQNPHQAQTSTDDN